MFQLLFYYMLEYKILTAMRAMREKLNTFMLQLLRVCRVGARWKHLAMKILWVTVRLLLVQLNKMSLLSESKVLSFSFWFCSGRARKGDKSKISFCYPRGLRASPQTYHGEGAESIVLLIFVLWCCFNSWQVKVCGLGQKVLFRASFFQPGFKPTQ